MKRLTAALVALTTIRLLCAQERPAPREALDLAQQGTANCSIVIAERPSPAARLAALELQYHILKISGAEVSIRSESDSIEGSREVDDLRNQSHADEEEGNAYPFRQRVGRPF